MNITIFDSKKKSVKAVESTGISIGLFGMWMVMKHERYFGVRSAGQSL